VSAGDIFIVDDNPVNLTLLAGILRQNGYEVRFANTGRRALKAIELHVPELVMLDVNMPEMNGYEVCRHLKDDERTRDVPVIFLSALDDVHDKLNAFRAGGVDYVTKPFHAEEVLARVESQLKLARLRQSLEEKNRELERKHEELTRAWRENEVVFSTLTDVLEGTTLDGKYRLDAKIGVGGFAAVYRGKHLGLDRDVAVKVLRPYPGQEPSRQLQQFRIEGISATRVNHPNAVAVLDCGHTSTGVVYLVMELLSGRTLESELAASGTLSLERCREIITPVCGALAEAHAAGIIHRDVKPANIFLHRSNAGEVVKVVDFGIAKHFEHEHAGLSTTGRIVGTPVYISPERLLDEPYDGRADAYGVGVTMYQMLSGRLPHDSPQSAGVAAVIVKCLHEAPVPLSQVAPSVPRSVEAIVMRALAKNPEHRLTVAQIARLLLEESATGAEGGAPIAYAGVETVDARPKGE
jgi:CheY-like chemotaxis protein